MCTRLSSFSPIARSYHRSAARNKIHTPSWQLRYYQCACDFIMIVGFQRRRSDLKSGGTEKFRLAPSALAKFLHICSYTWHPQKNFKRGAKLLTPSKIDHFFGARKTQTTICAFFTTFKTKLKGVYCKRRRREQKFKGVFKTAEYDVIFIPWEGAASAPPRGTYVYIQITPMKR